MSETISGFHGVSRAPTAWAAPVSCLLPHGFPAYFQILGGAPQSLLCPSNPPHVFHGLEHHYSSVVCRLLLVCKLL